MWDWSQRSSVIYFSHVRPQSRCSPLLYLDPFILLFWLNCLLILSSCLFLRCNVHSSLQRTNVIYFSVLRAFYLYLNYVIYNVLRAFALCIGLPVLIWVPWIFGWYWNNFLIFWDRHNGLYLVDIKCVFCEWMKPHIKKKSLRLLADTYFLLDPCIVPSTRDTKPDKHNPAFKSLINLLFHVQKYFNNTQYI